jgi:hypothetical protein
LTDKNDISLEPKREIMTQRHIQLPIPSKQLIYALPQQKNTFAEDIKSSGKKAAMMKVKYNIIYIFH